MKEKIKQVKSDWYLWLFPSIALLFTVWLIADYYQQHGPKIQITFDDAPGIQAEKTKVRYRGVPVGTVTSVYISEDLKKVVAEVQLRKDGQKFALEGSKFSLVTPKVNFQGITGLETILEGAYIEVLPGNATGARQKEFKAQANSSFTEPRDETSSYLIEAVNADSVVVGDPVTYRGLKIGAVTNATLSKEGQSVLIHINIENKYSRLVRNNTQFWKKVGVQAKLGLFNSEIKVNSMSSLMSGGIEIGTPTEAQAMAKANARFPFLNAPPKGYEKWNPVLEFP